MRTFEYCNAFSHNIIANFESLHSSKFMRNDCFDSFDIREEKEKEKEPFCQFIILLSVILCCRIYKLHDVAPLLYYEFESGNFTKFLTDFEFSLISRDTFKFRSAHVSRKKRSSAGSRKRHFFVINAAAAT